MTELTIYGRRLDSSHSATKTSTLQILHLNQWPAEGIDYQAEARKLVQFLAMHVAAGTMQVLEWGVDRDLAQEIERLRAENAKLAERVLELQGAMR